MMDESSKYLGVMIDCSRNAVMKVSSVKKLIDILSAMGYNLLQLYTEDTYEVDNEPYFGYMRGRYSKEELKEIDRYALEKGMELMPCIQTLAHLNAITRWEPYSQIIDCNDILLAGEDRTYELLDHMFSTIRECFSSNRVNIGMDEAHMVGLGKYLDKHGFQNRFDIMIEHLKKVNAIATKYQFKPIMWSDMFFRLANGGDYYAKDANVFDEVNNKIPDNVSLVYWDYYSTDKKHYETMIKNHKQFKNEIWYAGGAWTWNGFAPFNRFSMETIKASIQVCKDANINNMLFTIWGDNGAECSAFSVLPSLLYAAELYHGNTDMDAIKQKFLNIVGMSWDDFMLLDNANKVDRETYTWQNPCKYMLYNDLFLGVFDSTVKPDDKEKYKIYSQQIDSTLGNEKFGYLFKTQKALMDVLYIKYDLGLRIRNAYKEKNVQKLQMIINDGYNLVEKIERFYKEFQIQWDTDYKPHGFDVQDIRIGGLLLRIKHCMEKLTLLVTGKINLIEELEEELLDFEGNGMDLKKEPVSYNIYSANATVNIL